MNEIRENPDESQKLDPNNIYERDRGDEFVSTQKIESCCLVGGNGVFFLAI
jgi:hypothetical protein